MHYPLPQTYPRIDLSNGEPLISSLLASLRQPEVGEDLFDLLQEAVFVKLDSHPQFYGKFKKQEAYVQLLADFDLLNGAGSDDGTGSWRGGGGGKTDPDGLSIASLDSRDSCESAYICIYA